MPWFSLLPPYLSFVEVWAERVFLILSILTIGPWLLMLTYDILLYVWRSATYDFPYLGGRARGRQRPRAPSLIERPNGHPRAFSFGATAASGLARPESEELKRRRDEGDAVEGDEHENAVFEGD